MLGRERVQAEVVAHLVRVEDLGIQVDLINLSLGQRVEDLLVDVVHLQVAEPKVLVHDEVDQVLEPLLCGCQALGVGRLLLRVGRGAVVGFNQLRRRYVEAIAHDAAEPLIHDLVVLAERRLLRVHDVNAVGDKPAIVLAGPDGHAVPPLLELTHIIRVPRLRHGEDRVWHVAVGEILELVKLPAEGDVDSGDDLLDRAEPVDPVGPHVARSVDQLLLGIVHGRHTVQDLLISRVRRHRHPSVAVQDPVDGGAVDWVEAEQLAAEGQARIDARGVDDQQVLDEHPQPGFPVVLLVGIVKEVPQELDPPVALLLPLVPEPEVDDLGRHLVLAGFDTQPEEVVAVRQAPQVSKGGAFAALRGRVNVVLSRVVEPTANGLVLLGLSQGS